MEEDLSNPGSILFSIVSGQGAGHLGIANTTNYSTSPLKASTGINYSTEADDTIVIFSFRQVTPNTLIIVMGNKFTSHYDEHYPSGCLTQFNRQTNKAQFLGDGQCTVPCCEVFEILVDNQKTQLCTSFSTEVYGS